jgi:transketolase
MIEDKHPAYVRIARESATPFAVPSFSLDRGAYVLREGADIVLVASGVSVLESLRAADLLAESGVLASVVSVPVLQPFPKGELAELIGDRSVVCVFEGYRGNPLSIGVMEVLLEKETRQAHLDLCAPHCFPTIVGGTEALRRGAGLDAAAIAHAALGLTERPALFAQPTRRSP